MNKRIPFWASEIIGMKVKSVLISSDGDDFNIDGGITMTFEDGTLLTIYETRQAGMICVTREDSI